MAETHQESHKEVSDHVEKSNSGFLSTLTGFFAAHKVEVIAAAVGFAVVGFIITKQSGSTPSTTATTGANSSQSLCQDAQGNVVSCTSGNAVGNLASSGYQDSGTAMGLTQISTQLDNLAALLGTPPAGAIGPAGPPGPAGSPGTPGTTPQSGMAGVNYGLIPFGTANLPNYSNLKPNTFFTWGGVKYLLKTGPAGKLFGVNPQGKQVLLYQPASFYPGGSNFNANAGAGQNYGLIPFGKYTGPSYSNLKPGTQYSYNGTNYTLSTGPKGELFGTTSQGQKSLLYEPASFYPGGINYGGTHDPVQSGIMAHTKLYHRAPGMPITATQAYSMEQVSTAQLPEGTPPRASAAPRLAATTGHIAHTLKPTAIPRPEGRF